MAVVPKKSKGATKGLRVINFIVFCVLKSNFLDHKHVLGPFAAAAAAKHLENIVVSSSNYNLLYLMPTGGQHYG